MSNQLQTIHERKALGIDLDHQSMMLFTGSCFAENIGAKLKQFKFNAEINPLGISYNPLSLFNLLERSIEGENFKASELHFENERYFSFDLHSSFSDPKVDRLIKQANLQLDVQTKYLAEADALFITMGTAWVHVFKKEKQLVNNCHKLPAKLFSKTLLSVNDITAAWDGLAKKIQARNPMIRIIFTVSPVRHLKDGFRENQLSKSTLHLAVEEICNKHRNCFYFPSYEIMMDELRDYRFYDRDLVHPNALGIDIIWEYFQKACLSNDCSLRLEELNKLLLSVAHRPFNVQSNAHQKFLKKLNTDLQEFAQKHRIDLQSETTEVKSKLIDG